MFRQFGRPALQIRLIDFNHCEEFVSLAFPFGILIFPAEAFAQKAQVMGAAEQTSHRVEIICQILQNYGIHRAQDPQIVPKPFRPASEPVKILWRGRALSAGQRFSCAFIAPLHRASKFFAIEMV